MRSSAGESSRVDVYRVVAARFLSRAGSEAAFFVGIWGKAAFVLHATPSQLAVIMFALAAGSILGTVVSGVLVDRYGPKRVLAIAELTFVPAALGMFFAHSIGALSLLVGVWAFAGSPVVTAGASFAPFLTADPARLSRINALIEGSGSAAMLVGPALGALITHFANVDWVFVADAATSVVAALIVWTVHLRAQSPRTAEDRHPWAEFKEGISASFSIRPVRFYILAGSVVWLSFGAFGVLEPLFFRDVVHTGVETLGWINTFFGMGLLAGAALLPRLPRKVISARWLVAFMVLNGLGALVYVGSSDLRRVVVGAVLWGIAIGGLEPLLRTLLHRDTPHELVGRVMGTAEVARRLGEIVPLTVAPIIALRFGVQATLIGFGLTGGAIGLLSLPRAAALDREHPPGAAELQPFTTSDEPISPNS
jgi:MFS transporter, DHA3 family, macrolide efflux protein